MNSKKYEKFTESVFTDGEGKKNKRGVTSLFQ